MHLKFYLIFLLTVLGDVNLSEAYNILVIFGHPGISHYQAFDPLFKELGAKGHNVTILSHVPLKDDKNIKHVPLSDQSHLLNVISLKDTKLSRISYYLQPKMISDFASINCPQTLSYHKFTKFLQEDHQFDVIMVEFFNTNCYYGVINKFKAPFIGLSSCTLFPWQSEWFGAPDNPAYSQVLFMGYKTPMTFLARVENTLLNILDKLWYKYLMEEPGKKLSKKFTGLEAADPHNASLVLVNTHYTLHGVKPVTPGIIEVGGMHVSNRKLKKLPENIESWINNSDAGVIYFSLGSMIKGDTFPEEQRKAFARAFAKLPQRVLWKWENDTMQDKPGNVMIGKWMPQFDILCNPKVIAFISHGGLLGTTEAVHCGVPMIVMPQFGDQMHNAHAIENSGGGVILNLHDATEGEIVNALHTVLSPQMYNDAKALSERFRDRPLPPLDTAVYWVEYVARHKGAAHMRSPVVDMPFYQYFLIDVIAFIGLIIAVLAYLSLRIIRVFVKLLGQNGRQFKHKMS